MVGLAERDLKLGANLKPKDLKRDNYLSSSESVFVFVDSDDGELRKVLLGEQSATQV